MHDETSGTPLKLAPRHEPAPKPPSATKLAILIVASTEETRATVEALGNLWATEATVMVVTQTGQPLWATSDVIVIDRAFGPERAIGLAIAATGENSSALTHELLLPTRSDGDLVEAFQADINSLIKERLGRW